MSDKDEILDECEDKINNLEESLLIYIDERLRKIDKRSDEIIARLKKLELFYPTY
jgi:hypothetical protein